MILFKMTLAGSILICILSVFRLLFRNKVHKSIFPAVWTLVSLRLLIPHFYSLTVSVPEAPQFIQNYGAIPSEAVKSLDVSGLLSILWLVGAAVCFLLFAGAHLRSCLRYRFSVPIPVELPDFSDVRVRMMDGLDAPLTYGIFRPTVLLPASFDWDDENALRHILIHEKTHIRYMDIPRKAIMLLAVCVHWFNPLVWLMLRLSTQDAEIRCDSVTVKLLGKGACKEYAKTLVAAEEHRYAVLQVGFSFNYTLARLNALAKSRVSARLSACASACFVVICLISCLTLSFAAEPIEIIMQEAVSVAEIQVSPSTEKTEERKKPIVPVAEATKSAAPSEHHRVKEPIRNVHYQSDSSAEPELPEWVKNPFGDNKYSFDDEHKLLSGNYTNPVVPGMVISWYEPPFFYYP